MVEYRHAETVVAAGGAMQQVRTAHTTAVAVQRPRSLAVSKRRLEEEAALSGERFFYGWAAGKDRIEGPSVKLANAAARCWGNCAVEMLPVQDAPDSWVFSAVFIDLETGFTLTRQFRQAKTSVVSGRHDEARKSEIRFNIGVSKATRNVILNSLPAGLIDAAMDAAKSGVRDKIQKFIDFHEEKQGKGQGIVKVVDLMLRDLAKHGVTEPMVLQKLEIGDRKAIDVERLIILSGDRAALNDGEARREELYPVESAADRVNKIKAPKPEDGEPPFPKDTGELTPLEVHARALEEAESPAQLAEAYAAAFKDDRLSKGDKVKLANLRDERAAAVQAEPADDAAKMEDWDRQADTKAAHEATK